MWYFTLLKVVANYWSSVTYLYLLDSTSRFFECRVLKKYRPKTDISIPGINVQCPSMSIKIALSIPMSINGQVQKMAPERDIGVKNKYPRRPHILGIVDTLYTYFPCFFSLQKRSGAIFLHLPQCISNQCLDFDRHWSTLGNRSKKSSDICLILHNIYEEQIYEWSLIGFLYEHTDRSIYIS